MATIDGLHFHHEIQGEGQDEPFFVEYLKHHRS